MRVQIASDLHLDVLENVDFDVPPLEIAAGAEVLILAGDVHCGLRAVNFFEHWPIPVIYVSGNHEAFGLPYASVVDGLRARAAGTQVRYLERRSVVIDGVRFLGACLWTDYELYDTRDSSMEYARAHMSDHTAIWLSDTERFTPEHASAEHKATVDWLKRELSTSFGGKTVVVTHHGISPDSIHPRFLAHPINPGFLSDLRSLVHRADLWIHGHVHDSFDYFHGTSRVVANPRGYPTNLGSAGSFAELTWENRAFCSTKIVEI